MKLLYITNRVDGSGGLERVLSIKASFLADKLGYEVHILTLNQPVQEKLFYEFSKKIVFHNIDTRKTSIKYIKDFVFGIKKSVKQISPNIICVCDDGLKGFFIPKIINNSCPIIYERHVSKVVLGAEAKKSRLNNYIRDLKYRLMDYCAKSFDAFVVLTNENLKEWKGKNLKVISNPLSFYPEKVSSLNSKKVIAVGKHCYQKGYDRLFLSWKSVIEKHPDWVLEIYGQFNKDHDLEALARKLEIENNIKLFKPVKNISEKFLDSSLHVLSSRYEGFGMVIIEAMSCGVPSIAFNCPYGPSDIILNNKNGLLVEEGNINQLSNSLIHLIENNDERKKMGETAKESVKKFLPENILQQWDQLFTSLIKN